jgi:hypothetical protein
MNIYSIFYDDLYCEKEEYTVKKGWRFSCPHPGCQLPNSPWPGKIKLFLSRDSLVNDIPAGDRENR